MRTATYVVQLKSAEKQALEAMLKKSRQSARELRRARVLLLCREKHQGNPSCDRHERSRHPECEETLWRRGSSVEGQTPSRSAEKARQPGRAAWTQRFEFHYIPIQASWLNMAELELSVISRQCLHRRIDALEKLAAEAQAWATDRNARKQGITWCFTTKDARRKLERFYGKN